MGYGGWLGKIPMHIPNDSKSFCDFRKEMINAEQNFIASISRLSITESNTAELDSKDEQPVSRTCVLRRIRNLFCESEKLVTTCSLCLGFDLPREKNCIELRPILSDCRMRDRENLAGSAPRYPHFANHLI